MNREEILQRFSEQANTYLFDFPLYRIRMIDARYEDVKDYITASLGDTGKDGYAVTANGGALYGGGKTSTIRNSIFYK